MGVKSGPNYKSFNVAEIYCGEDIAFVINTEIVTPGATSFEIRTTGTCTYIVDWGDESSETVNATGTFTQSHNYSVAGVYTVKIEVVSGNFYPYYNNNANGDLIIKVRGKFDSIFSGDFSESFYGASNIDEFTVNLSNVTDFSNAFKDTGNLMDGFGVNDPSELLGESLFNFKDLSSGTNFTDAWRDCTGLTSFPLLDTSSAIYFNQAWLGCTGLTSFPQLDTSSATRFDNTWNGCTGLTTFPLLDTSSVTNFSSAWRDCNSLTSFPLIDTSAATNFSSTWYGCGGLTSFPALNTSNVTDFYAAWLGCGSLTSFPVIDTSQGQNMSYAWHQCSSLTSFPSLDFSSATRFLYTWLYCTNLANVPAGLFDTVTNTTDFTNAFGGCALTAQSIENILVSIDTANQSTGTLTLGIGGGTSAGYTTWSSAAQTALSNLQGKGWTVSYNP